MAVVETTTLAAPQTIVAWASGWIESFGPDDINDCFFTASREGVSRRTWIPPLLPLALLLLSHQPLKPKILVRVLVKQNRQRKSQILSVKLGLVCT
ncbi:hypothetical protein BT96DRAFT_923522 [Gymnopus androsaceus JB14]|uniref:Uncharacterized protein n=1 Tax=Gymnopus androsaceus JB14 TaxID=1447944 RepID=A0A6A4HA46_9AGAR|nr:hypothetical protein BT96DRAFT_923522 [Gymnopus androsaceus JB14]